VKNFITRTLTGVIFVAILIGSIIFDQLTFIGLFSLLTIIATIEFYKMFEESDIIPQKYFGILLTLIVFLAISFLSMKLIPVYFLGLIMPLLFVAFVLELYRKKKNPIQNIAITLLPILYIGLSFGLLNIMVNFSPAYNYNILLGFFFLIWSFDSFAYLTGVLIGKHRMIERISPKKSWEGFIGGYTLSIGIAVIISVFFKELTVFEWIFMSVIISVVGTYGDLVESMFKRSIGIKDSGNVLPGHGGILDRFDAVFLASPFVVGYLVFIYKFARL